jgi:hypothetical protein
MRIILIGHEDALVLREGLLIADEDRVHRSEPTLIGDEQLLTPNEDCSIPMESFVIAVWMFLIGHEDLLIGGDDRSPRGEPMLIDGERVLTSDDDGRHPGEDARALRHPHHAFSHDSRPVRLSGASGAGSRCDPGARDAAPPPTPRMIRFDERPRQARTPFPSWLPVDLRFTQRSIGLLMT